ncbi:MAG TPA: hypothetical protein VF615_30060 [Longimicrobiaceae bacterium]|jgi:hypothetical protein
MRATLVLLCLTAGCGLAPRSAPLPASVAALAGCYALEYGAWGPEIHDSGLHSATELPAAIHLTAKPSGWREGRRGPSLGYMALALSGGTRGYNPFPVWRPVGTDSVRAGVPIQFGGFNLHLARDGADLRGDVEAYGGPGPPSMRTSVTARRIPCPAS